MNNLTEGRDWNAMPKKPKQDLAAQDTDNKHT